MKLNWKQIYDFWGFGLESLICWYLYKGNKRSLSFEIIKSVDYIDFIFSTTKVLIFSVISVFLMMSFYILNPRLFLLMNAILSIIICYICFKNNWIRIGALILLCVFSFRFLIYNNSKLKEAFENSSVYVAKVQRLLPLFFLYSIAKTVASFTLFHMLISFDFTGLRFYLFIFMNVIFILAMNKKIMAEVVFLFLHKTDNRGLFTIIFNRLLSTGTIALSALLRPIFILFGYGKCEEYSMIYAIIHRETYFKSISTIYKLQNNDLLGKQKVYIRRILYPYVLCSMAISRLIFTESLFYEDYELYSIIFYLHSIVIETFYTFQSSIKFVLKSNLYKNVKNDTLV